MEKKERNRKEWVKNALIVFLVIMLVLTFFSNTIMNRSLPEVSSAYISSGSINTSIKGSGVITSVDPYVVTISQGRRIESVNVSRGETVNKGDVLFVLEEGESSEVSDAKKIWDTLRFEYQTYIIEGAISQSVVDAAERKDADVLADKMNRLYARALTVSEKKEQLDNATDKLNAHVLQSADATKEQEQLDIVNEAMAYQNQLDDVVTNYNYLSPEEQEAKKDETINKIVELSSKRDEILKKLEKYGVKEVNDIKSFKSSLEQKITDITKEHDAKTTVLEREKNNAELAWKQAENDYNSLKKEIDDQKYLEAKLEEIENAKATYDRLLNKSTGNEVVAPVSGVITSVSVVAGEKVSAEQELAVIQLTGKDYILEMPVSKEQAARIHVGDQGKPVNSWYYYDLNMYVSSIKPDMSDPKSGNKIVVFTVSGSDVMVGQSLQVTVGDRASNYDKIVPNTAIREDKNGTYILIITSKSTPLGNRYVATRVDVTKIASDDTSTAISCGLEGYESVITTATKPVSDGDLVRLPD